MNIPSQYIVIFQNSSFKWSHVLIPAIVSGLLTWLAVWWTNKKNTERWLNEGFLKKKIELKLLLRKKLLAIKLLFDELPSCEDLNSLIIDDKFDVSQLELLNKANSTFEEIKRKFKDYHQNINGFLKDDYDVNLLLEEYKIFDNYVEDFQEKYNKFNSTEPWSHPDGFSRPAYGILDEDLLDEGIRKVIRVLYETKFSLENLVKKIIQE